MKTHYKSDEIAHIWAHKSAPHGNSPAAMSFNGEAFLSYSTEIARHCAHKGKPYILLDTAGFSVTTSGHQNTVRAAIPEGIPVFRVERNRGSTLYGITGKELFEFAVKEAAEYVARSEKARQRKDSLLASSLACLEDAKRINEFFGLKRKVDSRTINRLRVATAATERKNKLAAQKRDEEGRAKQRLSFYAWLRGETVGYFRSSLFPVAFRVEGGELVSTMGARVPLKDAKRAFSFALAHRETAWHQNGETCPVGNYALNAINAQGVVAGCHRISWQEIDRLSPVLGK